MKGINKLLRVLFVFTLSLGLFLPTATLAKEEANIRIKDEVIYSTLTATGTSKSAYVVNVFEIVDAGDVVDYGKYSTVKNLTDLTELTTENEKVHFSAEKGKFYYQGNLEAIELPWDITVTYYLDGDEIEPEQLLGKSGNVKIVIETSAVKTIDAVFFDHYTLQITVPFDGETFSNIKAPGATVAKAGKTEQVTFTILPEEEAELSVTADVTDFELAGIDIAAIPFMMTIDDPDTRDMVDDMDSLSDAIADMHKGVGKLRDGIHQLGDGADELQEGSAEFQKGLVNINDASVSLVSGSNQIKEALVMMERELSIADQFDLSEVKGLIEGLVELENTLRNIVDDLYDLADAYDEVYQTLIAGISEIPEQTKELELTAEEIAYILDKGIAEEKINYLLAHYEAAQGMKQLLEREELYSMFADGGATLQQLGDALQKIADGIQQVNKEITTALDGFDAFDKYKELTHGFEQFITEYSLFHDGLVSYTDGVGTLTEAYVELHDGVAELAKGTDGLTSGIKELHDGTFKLNAETNTLPEDMQAKIDRFLEGYDYDAFEPQSFLSPKNKKIGVVQFILRTEAIEHPESDETKEEEETKQGFWEMLKGLFRR